MKPIANVSLALFLALSSAAYGDTVVQTTVVTTTDAAPVAVRANGFTVNLSQVVITREGKSEVMAHNMRLHNGIFIRPDGVIVVPGKMNRTLNSGDWLSFDGAFTKAVGCTCTRAVAWEPIR